MGERGNGRGWTGQIRRWYTVVGEKVEQPVNGKGQSEPALDILLGLEEQLPGACRGCECIFKVQYPAGCNKY